MSISLSGPAVAELLVHSFDKWNHEKKKLFLTHVLTACENRTEEFLKYIESPKDFVSNDPVLKIGDKIFVKDDALWSNDKAYLINNNLITQGVFQAVIVDFEFVSHEKVVIEYPSEKGFSRRSIFFSYIEQPDLL